MKESTNAEMETYVVGNSEVVVQYYTSRYNTDPLVLSKANGVRGFPAAESESDDRGPLETGETSGDRSLQNAGG